MSLSRLPQILLTALLASVVITLALNQTFFRDSISAPFMAVAIASILLIHFSIRPLLDLVPVVLVATALFAAERFIRGWNPNFWPLLCVLGLGSALTMAVRAIWASHRDQRNLMLCGLIPSLLLSFSDWTASMSLRLTEAAHPRALDLYLYRFDCSLGFQPSFLVGQYFKHWHWFYLLGLALYIALPVPLALVYGQQLKAKGRAALPLFYAFLIAGPLGIIFFNLLPAMGPAHVFPRFPAFPSNVEVVRHMVPIALRMPGSRNAIPSLHMAWVLLAWWGARGLRRWVQFVALTFVIFTFVATMGTGEHYLVDLVVACPFALTIHAGFAPASSTLRKSAALWGICLTLAWIAALSFAGNVFWFSRFIPWSAMIATIGWVALLVSRLASEQESPVQAAESINQMAAVAN
jgi:hypothetical protein